MYVVVFSTLPPTFFFSVVWLSSIHWYISTSRLSLIAVAETPNTPSESTSCVSALPLMWTSLPSFSASTLAFDSTETHAPSPSSIARAVFTELPSFQKSTGNPPMKSASPKSTPLMELPRREPQLSVVVSVTAMTYSPFVFLSL